jgi:hypothetical protein
MPDLDAMRKDRESHAKGADFYAINEGDTVAYIAPECRPGDPLCYLEVIVHYGVGGKGMHLCLDANKNKILQSPHMEEFIASKGIDVEEGCPTCQAILAGSYKTEDDKKRVRAQSRYLWNIIPIKHRVNASGSWALLGEQIVPLMAGYSIWDGIMEGFAGEGDLTDRERALFIRINRKGKGQNDTKYQVQLDSDSLRKPVKLSPSQCALLDAALVPNGTGDLYKIAAGMMKSHKDVKAMLSGVAVATSADEGGSTEGSDRPEGAPSCYGVDVSSDDPECQACEFKDGCAKIVGVDVPPDPAPAKKAAPAKAAPAKPAPRPQPSPLSAKPAVKAAPKLPPEPEPEPEAVEEPAAEAEGIPAGEAEIGASYALPDGTVGECTGKAKGKVYFANAEGDPLPPLTVADVVVPAAPAAEGSPDASATATDEAPAEEGVAEEAPAEEAPAPAAEGEEDPELAEMERMLAARKGKVAVAAKPVAAKPPAAAPKAVAAKPALPKPAPKAVAAKK